MTIYEDKRISLTLSKAIDRTIEDVKSGTASLDDCLGQLSMFINMIGYSEKNDDLIFLRVLVNTMAGIYGTQRGRYERRKQGKSEKETKEIDGKLEEMKERGTRISLQTLANLKEALASKDPRNKVIESLQAGLVQMDKELVEPYP